MCMRILLTLTAAATLLAAEDRIPSGMNQFATATYGELASGRGNIIFSPFNIATALSMALAVVGFFPTRSNSPVYSVTYVDALAAHTDSHESVDYVDLAHVDGLDDVEEL